MRKILTNMCMIFDKINDKVLVLDKYKRYGWEGLTFHGGHVEKDEMLLDSCKREVFEETGFIVDNLKLSGITRWVDVDEGKMEICFMYYTETFKGDLIEKTEEGVNKWMKLDELKSSEGKSYSLDKILELYLSNEYSELYIEWSKNHVLEKIL